MNNPTNQKCGNKKKKRRKRYQAVVVEIDKRKVETVSRGILVAAAEWRRA